MRLHHRVSLLLFFLSALILAACQSDGTANHPAWALSPTATNETQAFNSLQDEADHWREQTKANPENAEAYYHLGLKLMVLSPGEAGEPLAQAAKLEPNLEAGINRLRSALRQAAAVDDQAYQYTVIGQALASVNEWALAEAALEVAVESDPDYAEAWAYLGEARSHNETEDALDALQTAHDLDPDSLSANLFLSLYYQREGTPGQALPYLRAALKHDPGNLALNQNLAQTLVDAGMVEQAFEHLQSVVEANPTQADRWIILAKLSLDNQLKTGEIGLPAAREAALLSPDEPQADLLLGRAYLQEGNLVLAERFLTEAANGDPTLAAPHYYLGVLYLNSERLSLAKEHLIQARELAAEDNNLAILELAKNILEEYFHWNNDQ
jgi:tetratricopeptide (TPR) repeat protein